MLRGYLFVSFIQNTFGDILKNIKEHYKRLDIVKTVVGGKEISERI